MVLLSLLLSSSVQISLISEQRNLKFTFKHAHTYYLLLHSDDTQTNNNMAKK